MAWWAWVLLWAVLVVAGGLVLFVTARRLYRQGMSLAREVGAAADLFARVGRPDEHRGDGGDGAPAGRVRRGASAGRRPPGRGNHARHRRAATPQDVG